MTDATKKRDSYCHGNCNSCNICGICSTAVEGSFEDYRSRIEFYGKKADKTEAEYEAMTDDEKREYILLQYMPLCLKAAKKFSYDGSEFQDMYMQACVEILEVIDKYGLDDEDLRYHILSHVGIKVKRAGEADKLESVNISYDDEKTAEDIAVSFEDFDREFVEAEFFEHLARLLTKRQFEIACLLSRYGKQSAVSLARRFSVTRQTIAKDLAQIGEALEKYYAFSGQADECPTLERMG